ncbi:MAG: fumarylacetoacetate hydrolase family protein [Xanthomonadaceae bacterium]|nr:fumarylacetoacetate hydrolase family protein [Xanthomonadaceae bacterium]
MSGGMPSPDWAPSRLRMLDGRRLAVRHVWCVGQNYAEHAREMGRDPERCEPVFFSKPAAALVQQAEIEYPPQTRELHHEVELVVLLARGGRDLSPEQAAAGVFGYAVGCDLTRRDVQARAKAAGMPWALAKGFDQSGPVGEFVGADQWRVQPDRVIELAVNGRTRQSAVLGDLIWTVPELLARLSREVTLRPFDAVFTGTPAGVAALVPGDRVEARIEGLPSLEFLVKPGA